MIERIYTSARMSKIVKHSEVVYLCGQVGDGEDQTRDCLDRMDALLKKPDQARSTFGVLHPAWRAGCSVSDRFTGS